MPVTVTCPTCGNQGRLPDDFQGSVAKCGKCKMRFDITPWTNPVEPPESPTKSNSSQDLGPDLDSPPVSANASSPTPAPAKPKRDFIFARLAKRRPRLSLYLAGVASGMLLWAFIGLVWASRGGDTQRLGGAVCQAGERHPGASL